MEQDADVVLELVVLVLFALDPDDIETPCRWLKNSTKSQLFARRRLDQVTGAALARLARLWLRLGTHESNLKRHPAGTTRHGSSTGTGQVRQC